MEGSEGLRRRRSVESAEGENDAITLGGANTGGSRTIELDLSLNPNTDRSRTGLPPLPERDAGERRTSERRRQRRRRRVQIEGMEAPGAVREESESFDMFEEEGFQGPVDYSDLSDESESEAFLGGARASSLTGDDEIIQLAIQSRKTHLFVQKLYWISVLLLAVSGILLVRTDFKENWKREKVTDKLEMTKAIEGVFGLLVVITIAFRSDFPFNISVLIATAFFTGLLVGIVFTRHSIYDMDEEE